jgi:hypothetical protein
LLLQVVRQGISRESDRARRNSQPGSVTRQHLREAVANPKAGRPKHCVFAYRPTSKAFSHQLSFTKSRATRDEVIDALEAILRELHKAK